MNTDKYFLEDMECVSNAEFIPWSQLENKVILVTGATGLIGYMLINSLLYINNKRGLNLKILALVRDIKRAKERFKEIDDNNALEYILGNVDDLPKIPGKVHYIIHGASQTASWSFVNEPVETIMTAVDGTRNLLELAKEKKTIGFVYLSSMEIYGHPEKGHKVSEEEIGVLTPLEVRNCYPISKIQCESLCFSYAKEYGVPAMSVRLTQTFGPGVNYNDGRVFADFARSVIEGKDIILKTKGETERCYLYSADAVTAILTVMLKGEPGQAYNAANEGTYCSIVEMAEMVASHSSVNVRFEIESIQERGYSSTLFMRMDTSKLRQLGWFAKYELSEMYERMIMHMTKNNVT